MITVIAAALLVLEWPWIGILPPGSNSAVATIQVLRDSDGVVWIRPFQPVHAVVSFEPVSAERQTSGWCIPGPPRVVAQIALHYAGDNNPSAWTARRFLTLGNDFTVSDAAGCANSLSIKRTIGNPVGVTALASGVPP
jgi:hypothetical protein